jgi:DNA-binding CsgD family transcriptional regulator
VTVRCSRLKGQSPADQAAIDAALVKATMGIASTVAVGPADRRAAISFVPLPRREYSFNFAPAALAVIRGAGGRTGLSQDLLGALYGLTRSEAEVALAVATGKPRDLIAEERGVTVDTVRSQIKAIYQKLGVRREADLAIRLASLQEI